MQITARSAWTGDMVWITASLAARNDDTITLLSRCARATYRDILRSHCIVVLHSKDTRALTFSECGHQRRKCLLHGAVNVQVQH